MKKFFLFVLLSITFIVQTIDMDAQDINFPGISPSINATVAFGKRLDFNALTTSKIRVGTHNIDGVHYPPELLQNFTLAILSYGLTKHWHVGGGIGFEVNDPGLDTRRTNKRLIEQLQYTTAGKKWRFATRLRYEQRWFRYHYDPPAFGTRFRYQFQYVHSLNTHGLTWQLSNELFAIPTGPKNGSALLSENWVFTSLGFRIGHIGRLETGFGYDANVRNKANDLNNLFMFQFSWVISFNTHRGKGS